jgi:NADPH:quinone reductase-like Zn-dependent oxidoreductase
MKALRIHEYGSALQLEKTQPPVAGPGQVIVRNQATSLNPIDPLRASGIMRQVFPLQFPWTPGGDVSGIVESIGEGVTAFQTGDAVFGYSINGGAYAELVAIDAAALANRPQALTEEAAAAVGVVGQTAIQSLQLARVRAGKTVLIHGGSGGVGSLAIQIAHKTGAHVITTAQEEQKDTLLRLGADRVIDYSKERFEEIVEPVDAVLDLVGRDTLARSYGVIKRGGILVTANQPPNPQECEKRGIQGFFVQTKVITQGLKDFTEMVTAGSVVPVIDHSETLWNPEAIWAKRPSGTAVGKIVFTI